MFPRGHGCRDAVRLPARRLRRQQLAGEGVKQPRVKTGDFGTRTATGANKWFPLRPGYQSVRLGAVNRGSRRLPHRRVYTVTDVSKVISGVRTVVALDQDFDGGQIGEQALDYLAEDKRAPSGTSAPTPRPTRAASSSTPTTAGWTASKGGKAGIYMPAEPKVGMAPYAQEHAPGDDPTIAKVVKSGVSQVRAVQVLQATCSSSRRTARRTSTSRPASAGSSPSRSPRAARRRRRSSSTSRSSAVAASRSSARRR